MPKKIPIRKCCGCSQGKSKRELIRVVKNNEGGISIDTTGKKAGRGAYICSNIDCLNKARKARRFERSFESAIPDEVYAQLEQSLNELSPIGEEAEDE